MQNKNQAGMSSLSIQHTKFLRIPWKETIQDNHKSSYYSMADDASKYKMIKSIKEKN